MVFLYSCSSLSSPFVPYNSMGCLMSSDHFWLKPSLVWLGLKHRPHSYVKTLSLVEKEKCPAHSKLFLSSPCLLD